MEEAVTMRLAHVRKVQNSIPLNALEAILSFRILSIFSATVLCSLGLAERSEKRRREFCSSILCE